MGGETWIWKKINKMIKKFTPFLKSGRRRQCALLFRFVVERRELETSEGDKLVFLNRYELSLSVFHNHIFREFKNAAY